MIRQRYRHRHRTLAIELQRAGEGRFLANVDGVESQVEARLVDSSTVHIVIDGVARTARVARVGDSYQVALGGQAYLLWPEAGAADGTTGHAVPVSPQIIAPMPGKVLRVLVREGQEVARGDGLLILEAMKMENRIVAEAPATIRQVHVEEGQMVEGGSLLVEVEYLPGEKSADSTPS